MGYPSTMSFLRKAIPLLLATIISIAAQETDVLVYGATPGGIAVALAAAKHEKTVRLITPETDPSLTPKITNL